MNSEAIQFQVSLSRDLKPWLKSGFDLPTLTVEYLAGISQLSIATVIKIIEAQEISLADSFGNSWAPQLITDIPSSNTRISYTGQKRNEKGTQVNYKAFKTIPIRRSLQDIREMNESGLNLNPKRLIRQSRYESRAPGGGPVVKSGFQEKNLTGQFNTAVREKMKVIFVNQAEQE